MDCLTQAAIGAARNVDWIAQYFWDDFCWKAALLGASQTAISSAVQGVHDMVRATWETLEIWNLGLVVELPLARR